MSAGQWGFSIPPKRIAKVLKARIEKVNRRVTLQLLTSINERAPVDTGKFRSSWVYGTNTLNVTIPVNDPTSATSFPKLVGEYNAAPIAAAHYFASNIHYAVKLEGGWSGQAPSGVVRPSIRDAEVLFNHFVWVVVDANPLY